MPSHTWPIRQTGWAFFLTATLLLSAGIPGFTQPVGPPHEVLHGHDFAHDRGAPHDPAAGPQWEGSPEGIHYSEFNHRLAGIFILLIGLTELWGTLEIGLLVWSRFLLPLAMLGAGGHLLIWSDHEAWPVGSLSFTQTFFGGDWEIMQHKTYALFLLSVGAIEGLRWSGRLTQKLWSVPLPLFAVIGGLMLFLHSHGAHPSAHKIALDHAIMGTMAITGGFCKLVPVRTTTNAGTARPSRWDLVWAASVLLIGLQLLFYSE